jgi:hypothetical protein
VCFVVPRSAAATDAVAAKARAAILETKPMLSKDNARKAPVRDGLPDVAFSATVNKSCVTKAWNDSRAEQKVRGQASSHIVFGELAFATEVLQSGCIASSGWHGVQLCPSEVGQERRTIDIDAVDVPCV